MSEEIVYSNLTTKTGCTSNYDCRFLPGSCACTYNYDTTLDPCPSGYSRVTPTRCSKRIPMNCPVSPSDCPPDEFGVNGIAGYNAQICCNGYCSQTIYCDGPF